MALSSPALFGQWRRSNIGIPFSALHVIADRLVWRRSTLMIADKGFLHSNWPVDFDRRQRYLDGEYAEQEAERERRSTISHPRVGPHDLASFGAASV
jgi:hypothetical protein